jgi:hypothetical protein
MKYKIIEEAYYDHFGDVNYRTYYIKVLKNFLGIKYWAFIKHEEIHTGDICDAKTPFISIEEANDFINNILMRKLPVNKWITKEIPINLYK